MAKLAKSRNKSAWEQRLWLAVIAFANASEDDAHAERDFRALINQCLDWMGGDDDDIEICDDFKSPSLSALANKYRPEVVAVLSWVSAPVAHGELATRASEFLWRFGTDIRMRIVGNNGFVNDDDLLLQEWPDKIGSVISPVCKFVLDQIERHDVNGESLRDVIPIGQCEREGCNRFFFIERAGRGRFCSNVCRAIVHQSGMTKEERAERMRRYRQTLKSKAAKKTVKRGK